MGKARSAGDIYDIIKSAQYDNASNYALQRSGFQGAGTDRGTSVGSVKPDSFSNFKLDTRGGIMKGSLGFKAVATSELTSSGIIDMLDYNSPRLYLTNTSVNTLKVIIPSLGDGQELWIRSNAGVSTPILNTSGTGDETTGNIECMAGSNYTMTGDDWICFHYDTTDNKFHQVTAGKGNIGGGGSGGEVFTWTNDHASGGFDLVMGSGNIEFGTGSGTVINANSSLYIMTVASSEVIRISSTLFGHSTNVRPEDDSAYTLGTTSKFWSQLYTDNINMQSSGTIDMNTSQISDCGQIQQNANSRHYFGIGGNYIVQNSSNGNLEYNTNSTSVDHSFFVGNLKLNINKDNASFRQPIDMTRNNILEVNVIQSDSSVGFSENSIQMGDASNNIIITSNQAIALSDVTGAFFLSTSTGAAFSRDITPFFPLDIDLGTSSNPFEITWLQYKLAIFEDVAAGAAPVAITGWSQIFCRDDGSGKTQLRVKFQTGSSILLATEP